MVAVEAEPGADAPATKPGMSLNNRSRGPGQQVNHLEEGVPSDPALRASGVQARAERSSPSVPPVSVTSRALPLISIGSPAEPSLLEPTYAYLSAYCSTCLPPQVAQRINVAVYELYSNALRYGSPAGEVRLELEQVPGGVRLSVTNHADAAQRERLQARVALVRADPGAAFSGEMNRFGGSSQPPPMLGLVRVAHESNLTLELSVEGERVSVSTVCDG